MVEENIDMLNALTKEFERQSEEFCNEYIEFISNAKTERLCVTVAENYLLKNGFKPYNNSKTYQPGDKIYFKNRNKNIAAFVIGSNKAINSGLQLLGAHIDSPRLDVKANPLYEDGGIAYFDTQYYGGIKKYQWTTIPLAIYGVVCLTNGSVVNIAIGDKPSDPIFCISDLLPHLDKKLGDKKASDFIPGEKLDIIVGTTPLQSSTGGDMVKANVLKLLSDEHHFSEEDFYSAELEIVPAGQARYSGFDKSLIAGYGQDDRVCAYTSLRAVIDNSNDIPEKTFGVILVDKEEIGSCCNTGAKSRWFEDVLRCVIRPNSEIEFAATLHNTNMLSSDVTAAFDPQFADAYDKKSSAKLGNGLMLSKYNGGRGKSGGADANPEFIAYVRALFNNNNVKYQFDSMGKVDVGGGGTIASMICALNINVLDAGVPILNMHSPLELAHRLDICNAYLGYSAFIRG